MSDPETGQLIIEARIEFFDSDEETTKAVGMLTLQVYPDAATPSGSNAQKSWNLDLADLAFNRAHYDDVTRTYLFKLEVGPDDINSGSGGGGDGAVGGGAAGGVGGSSRAELRAFFLSSDGRSLEARLAVRRAR